MTDVKMVEDLVASALERNADTLFDASFLKALTDKEIPPDHIRSVREVFRAGYKAGAITMLNHKATLETQKIAHGAESATKADEPVN